MVGLYRSSGYKLQVGWPGLSRAIALTIVVTSAFWIALGAWLFRAHVASDHAPAAAKGSAQALAGGGGMAGGLAAGLTTSSGASYPQTGGRLGIPVAGVGTDKLVDTFAQGRAAGARRHDAIDILAAEGTPVLAAAPGKVEKLFLSGDGGNTIYVRSSDGGWIYYYAHLAGYAPGLREGLTVRKGQVLGSVGHTGNANPDAPHLHFALWRADPRAGWYQEKVAVDPYPLLGGKPVPAQVAQSNTSE